MATSKLLSGKNLGAKLTTSAAYTRFYTLLSSTGSTVTVTVPAAQACLMLVSGVDAVTHGLYFVSAGNNRVILDPIVTIRDAGLTITAVEGTNNITFVNTAANTAYKIGFWTINGTLSAS